MNLKQLKKYKVPIGGFLLADGVLSLLFFYYQPWWCQIGRVVRAGIGLLLLG